ncbi:hypothetical protein [Cupriavidus sp. D39]|uniref:hypothetical protein n=1 Tax=Cupriavidus sp. D39 TaxID=2997877 RepID=UPI00226D420F|nr:hypothetical protein [Cupriavidus sp. D39]MCY0856643.1 hypothetical protein [Cupriavidus sp. D39]
MEQTHTKISVVPVPDYLEIIERNDIDLLKIPADLAVLNGDLALTRRGDLMLNDIDYSACFSLVNWWRYNYPVMAVMFEAVFPPADLAERLDGELEELFTRAAATSPHPMQSFDYDAYHRINDARGAQQVARGVYAGAISVALSNAMQSFRADIQATMGEWDASSPAFGGCSLGQVIIASANNVRHADEWQAARPPSERQLQSMRVLAAALNEPLDPPDGSRHQFGREISPETLHVISGGDLEQLEANFFAFAKDLLKRKRHRAGI